MVITTPKWGSGAKLWIFLSLLRCTCTHPSLQMTVKKCEMSSYTFKFLSLVSIFESQRKELLQTIVTDLVVNINNDCQIDFFSQQTNCDVFNSNKEKERTRWTIGRMLQLSNCQLVKAFVHCSQTLRVRKSGSQFNYLKPHPLCITHITYKNNFSFIYSHQGQSLLKHCWQFPSISFKPKIHLLISFQQPIRVG